jgi:hypothetical protein
MGGSILSPEAKSRDSADPKPAGGSSPSGSAAIAASALRLWRVLSAPRIGRVPLAPIGALLLGTGVVAVWMATADRKAAGTALNLVPAAATDTTLAAEAAPADALRRATLVLAPPARTDREDADPAAAIAARLALLENQAARLEAAVARSEAAARRAVESAGPAAAQQDRFVLAMLHLQAAVGTARPWMREYQVAAALAPPGALPRPLAEVLASHAARGLATEGDLRERFAALAPTLVARAPRSGGLVEQAESGLRSGFAAIGLVSPPPPSDVDAGVRRIEEHMRRGNLGAAVADAATLDARLQPLIGGWLAQARARLAVEQVVQETLLRAIAASGPRPG